MAVAAGEDGWVVVLWCSASGEVRHVTLWQRDGSSRHIGAYKRNGDDLCKEVNNGRWHGVMAMGLAGASAVDW
jgi:hypothetical protein